MFFCQKFISLRTTDYSNYNNYQGKHITTQTYLSMNYPAIPNVTRF